MSSPSPDKATLEAIIASSCSGDREAFRVLYDLYKDKVYSIAFYYFQGNATLASDVTQQVFLKLMTSLGKFHGEAEFSTWLYRLVINACVDISRGRKPEVTISADIPVLKDTQETDYARNQLALSVRAAVSTLPSKFRVAVLLRHFEDMSYDQMAKALNCSMGTVASRLNRGHRMLAERLKRVTGMGE